MQAPNKEKRELDDKLITACREGDMAKVLRLMEAGADVNAVGPLNRTPLMTAALFGHTEICLHLFDHGAKLDIQSSAGETALHLATLNGHFSVVEFLLLEKADPNLTNSSGKKPRDYARKKDMRDLYAKAERGELDLDKTTERTAAALVQRDNKGPGFNPSNKMLGDLVAAGFEQALVLQCMYRLFEKGSDYNSVGLVIAEIGEVKKEKAAAEAAAAGGAGEKMDEAEPEDEKACKICFVNPIDSVLLNCGHLCCCMECGGALDQCPICRSPIAKIVRTFLS